jgi:SAM-dependent methyltransferase
MSETPNDLNRIYEARFSRTAEYRARIWDILAPYLSRFLPASTTSVLDLGCGYGEWINRISVPDRHGMDLNVEARSRLDPSVKLHLQDCTTDWAVAEASLDAVVTSNFFEHLPTKHGLRATLRQAHRALRPGGRILAMGPNIRYLHGQYWSFFDHHLALTDTGLQEVLELDGFNVVRVIPRFMPYTLVGGREIPSWVVRLYLAMPPIWPLFGRQFLVIAEKPKS